MSSAAHILVVDDDPRVVEMLSGYLRDEGFRVSTAANGAAMRACMNRTDVDLLLLDQVMPGEDGLSLVRWVRGHADVPIIMVTGRGEPIDRIVGLEMGADDYVTKPFHLRELLARVKSVLRRSQTRPNRTAGKTETASQHNFNGWLLDPNRRELRSPKGTIAPLTTAEFDLLCIFVGNPGRVLSRDQLMNRLEGRDWSPLDRSIDSRVSRLRRKIEPDPRNPRLIKSVRGVGYVFTSPVTDPSRQRPG